MPRMTIEQKEYLREHINDRPRAELARKLNISYNNLLQWVHKLGGEIDYDSFRRNDELRSKIKTLYETMSISEVAKVLHCKETSVMSVVHRMHLRRDDDETRKRLREKSNANMAAAIESNKRLQKIKRQIRVDIMRIKSGEKPLTNRYYRMYPAKTQSALNHLCCKYSYFMYPNLRDRKEPIAFYDGDTKRLSDKREQYYIDKYDIKFMQAED